MNKIFLMGRLTRDPEIRYSQGDNPIAIARYSLAVDKKQKREDGIRADFFQVVAFDRLGDFAAKYLRKGIKIVLSGHVQTGTYDNKDGVRMPFFEVVAEAQEFAESKASSDSYAASHPQQNAAPAPSMPSPGAASADGFMNIPDGIDEELPFN